MNSREIERLVAEITEPLLSGTGISLLDVQHSKEGSERYLRIFIEKDGGVSIDDCTFVSQAVGAKLDESDPIPGSYILQVSSPGEMPLRDSDDYQRFTGRYAMVVTTSELDGKRTFEGYLDGVIDQSLALRSASGDRVSIPLNKIRKARLAIPL